MNIWLEICLAVIASQGVWSVISQLLTRLFSKSDKKTQQDDAMRDGMIGLLHDKVMTEGQKHVDRGYISITDYEDYFKYFYDPYDALGGNGSGKRMGNAIKQLPIKN